MAQSQYYTWNQWNHFLTMIERRGFDVDDEREMTQEEWNDRFLVEENSNGNISEKQIEPFIFCDIKGELILVFFLPNVSVSLSNLGMFTNRMEEEKITHGIIIHLQPWTFYAGAALNMDSSKHYFETFLSSFFNFDRMTHIWQPDIIELLTVQEQKKLCGELNLKPHQFEKIKKDKVICKYWNWQKHRGRIIRFTTNSNNKIEISYRVISD